MKILYDYQAFTRQFYGGISRYFVEIAKRLAEKVDTDITVSAPFYINHYLQELEPGMVFGRQLSRAPKASGKLLNMYNRIAIRHQAADYNPDILHETYFSKKFVPLRDDQARVVTIYDMIHERFPEYFPAWDTTSANKRLAVERADHVICISENTRRDLLEAMKIDGDKVSVVHLGFDARQAKVNSVDRLIESPYLLYVGVRSGYKNFQRLLEAYASNPTLHQNFRIVCFGGGDFSSAERRQVRKLNLPEDALVWMGGPDSVLMTLYSHAAAFVYPSLYEGFGIPPLEAMAYDCPVVCSSGSSISEVVGDAGEFFDPEDSAAIAQAIEAVVESDTRMAKLVESGRRRLERFTWEKCADGTHEVYSSLV